MESNVENSFEELPLARAEMGMSLVGYYRVYADATKFKMVQADSAVHALEASGFEAAFKIEREAMHKSTLIFPSFAARAAAAAAPAAV